MIRTLLRPGTYLGSLHLKHTSTVQYCRRPSSRTLHSSGSSAIYPYNVLFCGTDEFAQACLKALHSQKELYNSISVLTPPDAENTWTSGKRMVVCECGHAAGCKQATDSLAAPVKMWAAEHNLDRYEVPKAGLEEWQPPSPFNLYSAENLLVTASFGHLIPSKMLQAFPASSCLNVHPSLLPQLRGAAPIQWAIARQLPITGITVQGLGPTFDSGKVYGQMEYPIPPDATYASLKESLTPLACDLFFQVLRNLPKCAADAWPQAQQINGLQPSHGPKVKRRNVEVQWARWTSRQIDARHRAFSYLYPLTTTIKTNGRFKPTQLRLLTVEAVDASAVSSLVREKLKNAAPGCALFCARTASLVVRCSDPNSFLLVTSLQVPGKAKANVADWMIGYRDRTHDDGLFHFV